MKDSAKTTSKSDPILTVTVVTLSGESKGTFEVSASETPADFLHRTLFGYLYSEKLEGRLSMDHALLHSDVTFAKQRVDSGAMLTLTLMPLGSKFYVEGCDPEQLRAVDQGMGVALLYNDTVVHTEYGTYDYTFRLSGDKYHMHASPVFNAPLFAADGVDSVDVLHKLREARAKGLIN